MGFGNLNMKCKMSCKGKDLLTLFMLMTILKNTLSWECQFPPGACPEKLQPPTHSETES